MDKGHITSEFTVWCGKCNNWEQHSGPLGVFTTYVREELKWKFTKKDGWICRGCAWVKGDKSV